MKKLLLPILVLVSLTAKPAIFDPQNTYVFVTGVLKWKDSKNLPPFSNVHRKDEELRNKLVNLGVPQANVIMLLDEKAQLKTMVSRLKALSAKCDNRSTFIFYYAGHGVKGDDGKLYLANYDLNVNNCAGTGFNMDWLSSQLPQLNKSKQFIFMGDCCYSGGLLAQGKKLKEKGRDVLVLSSATASNTSTGNWTFTQTVLDCLAGKPDYDHDMDGNITDKDMALEIKNAMKYREHQMNGYFSTLDNFVFVTKVSKKPGAPDLKARDGYVKDEYAYGRYENNWKPVRILSPVGKNYMARFYFYSDYKDVELTPVQLKKVFFPKHDIGDSVMVTWQGKKYKAHVLRAENDFYLIKYKGYDNSWNEWVMYDRISTGMEDKARIEESGTWYPGEVIAQKEGKYFIRYDGYDFSWDEWVGKNRIKFE